MKKLLAEMIPSLRGFARSLCGDAARADDLVQETLLRAWSSRNSFEAGTNLRAWLFTILRNQFFSHMRRSGREVPDPDGKHAAAVQVEAPQFGTLILADLRRALHLLPPHQREALILVSAGDVSYQDAAKICACSIGTVKSRVARARRRLEELLEGGTTLPTLEESAPTSAQLAAALQPPPNSAQGKRHGQRR